MDESSIICGWGQCCHVHLPQHVLLVCHARDLLLGPFDGVHRAVQPVLALQHRAKLAGPELAHLLKLLVEPRDVCAVALRRLRAALVPPLVRGRKNGAGARAWRGRHPPTPALGVVHWRGCSLRPGDRRGKRVIVCWTCGRVQAGRRSAWTAVCSDA